MEIAIMDKKTFERNAESFMKHLRWSDTIPVAFSEISAWGTLENVPENKRRQVLQDLMLEVRIREAMGRRGYVGSRCILAKAAIYEASAQLIAERVHADGTEYDHMMWAEFRRILSKEILHGYERDADE